MKVVTITSKFQRAVLPAETTDKVVGFLQPRLVDLIDLALLQMVVQTPSLVLQRAERQVRDASGSNVIQKWRI